MSIENFVIIALLVAFLFWRLRPIKGIRNISTAELKTELKNKSKQFIDVRTPGEFRGHSIKGFKNIPLDQLSAKAIGLSKEEDVIIICRSGMRSSQACRMLKKMGFQKLTNVKGGINTWN